MDMGSQFGVEKNDSRHKNSFFFKVKPVFRGIRNAFMAIMNHAKYNFNWLMLIFIFGI